ncbi:hypothetical protein [Aquimarina aggregata]|uniref:hypothetical protein n=1 Tax=Aquimarina aggregata TaxID=1642818 RepID=UPI002492428E|nr:hypothetical protein [Aquimarina aggregata]
MNIKIIITSIFIFFIFIACNKNDDETIPSTDINTIKFSEITVNDIANNNNSRDIVFQFQVSNGVSDIETLHILFTKENQSITETEAVQLTDEALYEIKIEAIVNLNIDEILLDSEGTAITEGINYTPHLLIRDNKQNTILHTGKTNFQLKNETVVTTLKLKSGTIKATEDIAIDKDLNLYVNGGSLNTSTLYKIDTNGNAIELSNAMNFPVGCTVGDDNAVYVTNFQSTNINKIDASGNHSILINNPILVGGGGIIITNNGDIYNTFFAVQKIFKIKEGSVEEFISSPLLNGPVGMTYDKDRDNIYIANFKDGKIFLVDTDNTLTEIAKTPASIGHMSYANNHLHITGWQEHKVFRLDLEGNIIDTIGTGEEGQNNGTATQATFKNPNGIEATPDGKIVYITDAIGAIRKIIMKRI